VGIFSLHTRGNSSAYVAGNPSPCTTIPSAKAVCSCKSNIRPYSERKSRYGRKKSVPTRGFACPNLYCEYGSVTDDTLHALVGYGHHNGIPRFKCQACSKVFTSRVNTPLYCLKTDPKQVEFVRWFLA
jgi:hypothetical protein